MLFDHTILEDVTIYVTLRSMEFDDVNFCEKSTIWNGDKHWKRSNGERVWSQVCKRVTYFDKEKRRIKEREREKIRDQNEKQEL